MNQQNNESIFESVADIFVGAWIFTIALQVLLGLVVLAFIVTRGALWGLWQFVNAFYEALIALMPANKPSSQLVQQRAQKIIHP